VAAENEPTEARTTKRIEPVYLTPAAFQLILNFEVGGGETYYNRKFAKPTWPGNDASGVTIGIGYDLGQNTVEQYTNDWKSRLEKWPFSLLRSSVGMKGADAKARLPLVATVLIPWTEALAVFRSSTIPRFYRMTAEAYPGFQSLPGDVQGALVSLIYNRGPGMDGDRRVEMRQIGEAVARMDLPAIAVALRAMKRLWEGQGMDGLIARREAEAKLVDGAV